MLLYKNTILSEVQAKQCHKKGLILPVQRRERRKEEEEKKHQDTGMFECLGNAMFFKKIL